MELGELLTEARIYVPLRADSLGEALRLLLPPDAAATLAPDEADSLLSRLRAGEGGLLRRASPEAFVFSLRAAEGDQAWAALGVAGQSLPGAKTGTEAAEGSEEVGPRALLVIRLPGGPEFGTGVMEGLLRSLRSQTVHARLLSAATSTDVREIRELMEIDLAEPLRVGHVLTPLQYRVFPETPFGEVVELMARRELRSLPVVGEDLQVLGMINASQALKHALEGLATSPGQEDSSSRITAGDVMSRSVMCVAEDGDLIEAAQAMANRDVSQLPVVRDGVIVGVLNRGAVLKAMSGGL